MGVAAREVTLLAPVTQAVLALQVLLLLLNSFAVDMTELFQTAKWAPQNPDLGGLQGTDPSAAASIVTVLSLAPVGEPMMIQANFRGDYGGVCFQRIVEPDDTTRSVAKYLAEQFAGYWVCQDQNISAQYTPDTSAFAITNFGDNLATVSAQRHPECFSIQPGGLNLDAGPILFMNRLPVNPKTGVPFSPPNGSNIGQVTFGSCRADNPGVPSTAYGVMSCNILSNDPNNLNAELAFYIMETANGAQTQKKVLWISKDGVFVEGRKI
jgi:hypothetical protein